MLDLTNPAIIETVAMWNAFMAVANSPADALGGLREKAQLVANEENIDNADIGVDSQILVRSIMEPGFAFLALAFFAARHDRNTAMELRRMLEANDTILLPGVPS